MGSAILFAVLLLASGCALVHPTTFVITDEKTPNGSSPYIASVNFGDGLWTEVEVRATTPNVRAQWAWENIVIHSPFSLTFAHLEINHGIPMVVTFCEEHGTSKSVCRNSGPLPVEIEELLSKGRAYIRERLQP